ncbi:MAG: IclR family transcriptional regulator C-terminal domain-containing protein [Hyphomicrobiales bacterium]
MERKPTDYLGSFAKGLSVIEVFSAERPRLSIAEVAELTALDRATARRCLLTLADLGYADYDGKFFRLTPRVLRLGTACLAAMPLPRIVQPWLDSLSQDTGQSTSVSILNDWEIVYVARAARQRLMSISLMPGSRLPAWCTSMGRTLLATLPEPEVLALLKRHPPEPLTPKSQTDVKRLLNIIRQAGKDGYTINDQEIELGLRSIAVPLYDSRNRVVAAMNVGVAAVQSDAADLRGLYLDRLLAVQRALKPLLV